MKTAFSILMLAATLAPAEPMADILARMDQAAGEFRSLSAQMKRLQFTAVLDESSEMDGVLRLRRAKGGTQGVIEFQQPEQRTVLIEGKTVQDLLSQSEHRGNL